MMCEICGKKAVIGRQISHSHRVTARKFKVNLHTRRAKIGGEIKKVKVCTKCLRKLEVV
ncbi:MAG: 50S ribosomal protein L28 [Candidatus Hydrothermales bacterium]